MSKGTKQLQSHSQSNLSKRVEKILKEIETDFDYPMSSDNQLLYGLVTHLEPLLKRVQNGIHLENPILNDIRNQNNDVLEMTRQYFSQLQELKDQNVSDGEWAYLTLHLLAAIEKYEQREKLNVLIICATGYGSAQVLKVRVAREFNMQMNIVDVISYYEITDKKLESIDLIISSIDLSTIVFKVPVIQVNVLLNEVDIRNINTYIQQQDTKRLQSHQLEDKDNVQLQQYSYYFDQYCSDYLFNYIEGSIDKESIYNRLIQQLSIKEDRDFECKLRNQLAYREELSTVLFSEAVAVPHTAQPVGDYSSIAVAIVPEGIYWNDAYQNIKVVIMLSPSKYNELKTIIDVIVNLIDSEENIQKLMECKTYQMFKDFMINQYR